MDAPFARPDEEDGLDAKLPLRGLPPPAAEPPPAGLSPRCTANPMAGGARMQQPSRHPHASDKTGPVHRAAMGMTNKTPVARGRKRQEDGSNRAK